MQTPAYAPSTYYAHCQQQRDPASRCARAKRDTLLCKEITRIWQENHGLYGYRKLWHALRREGWDVARCTVERLMRTLGAYRALFVAGKSSQSCRI